MTRMSTGETRQRPMCKACCFQALLRWTDVAASMSTQSRLQAHLTQKCSKDLMKRWRQLMSSSAEGNVIPAALRPEAIATLLGEIFVRCKALTRQHNDDNSRAAFRSHFVFLLKAMAASPPSHVLLRSYLTILTSCTLPQN